MMVKRAGDRSMVALVSQLGSRARPEPGWVARVAGVTRSEAEAAIAGVTAHASLVDQMSRTMAQTGRTYYAQFPAPIELYALVRLTGPDCLVETGVSAGVSSTFMLLGAKANKRGVLHSIDQPAPRADDGGGPAWSCLMAGSPAGRSRVSSSADGVFMWAAAKPCSRGFWTRWGRWGSTAMTVPSTRRTSSSK